MADEAHKEYKADVNANKENFELTPATDAEKTRLKCVHTRLLVHVRGTAVQSE